MYKLLRGIILPLFTKKIVSLTGVENLPTDTGFILAPNHVDWLDGFYLVAAIDKLRQVPVKFLSVSNNYWWAGITIRIPYQKDKIVDHAIKELTTGEIVCNFPEGARNFTSTLLPGKTGTVRMAITAGVPIVPVGIRCTPGETMGESIRFLRSPAYPVSIQFGALLSFNIPPGGISREWLSASTATLMKAIASISGKGYDEVRSDETRPS